MKAKIEIGKIVKIAKEYVPEQHREEFESAKNWESMLEFAAKKKNTIKVGIKNTGVRDDYFKREGCAPKSTKVNLLCMQR